MTSPLREFYYTFKVPANFNRMRYTKYLEVQLGPEGENFYFEVRKVLVIKRKGLPCS